MPYDVESTTENDWVRKVVTVEEVFEDGELVSRTTTTDYDRERYADWKDKDEEPETSEGDDEHVKNPYGDSGGVKWNPGIWGGGFVSGDDSLLSGNNVETVVNSLLKNFNQER